MDPILQRLQNLEALVFAGIPAISPAQVISQAGAGAIVVQGGLILITASGSVALTLGQPTLQQNGLQITILSANAAGTPFQNTVTTAAGGIATTGTPSTSCHQLTDSGAVGNRCTITAQNGTWIFGYGGNGWSAS
jgi:hypothetical protein